MFTHPSSGLNVRECVFLVVNRAELLGFVR